MCSLYKASELPYLFVVDLYKLDYRNLSLIIRCETSREIRWIVSSELLHSNCCNITDLWPKPIVREKR